jgi:membrane protease YdiL (CAAX protease family)
MFRMIGDRSVPTVVIALFAIVAALASFFDLFGILEFNKRYQKITLGAAMLVGLIAFLIWVFPFTLDDQTALRSGDGFTILGLACVIGILGLRSDKNI